MESDRYTRALPNGNSYIDGAAFFNLIFSKVDPSTVVGVANLKMQIEKADLASFAHNVADMIQHFKRIKGKIEAAGDRNYDEYCRLIWDALSTTQNKQFLMLTTLSKTQHDEGTFVQTFNQICLQAINRYNNLVACNKWAQDLQEGGEIVRALRATVQLLENKVASLGTQKGVIAALTAKKGDPVNGPAAPVCELPAQRTKQKDGRDTMSIFDQNRWKFEEKGPQLVHRKKTHFKCTKCGDRYGMAHMYVLHPEKDHKDLPQKRIITNNGGSNTSKKPNLTVNEDLKVAMLACSSEADVQALIEQFQEKE